MATSWAEWALAQSTTVNSSAQTESKGSMHSPPRSALQAQVPTGSGPTVGRVAVGVGEGVGSAAGVSPQTEEFSVVYFGGSVDIADPTTTGPNSDGLLTIPELISARPLDIFRIDLSGGALLRGSAAIDFGGLLGGWLLSFAGVDGNSGLIVSFLTALLGACLLLFVVKAVTKRA